MWQGHAAVLGDMAWPDTGREDKTDVWDKTHCYFQFLIPAPSKTNWGIGSPWHLGSSPSLTFSSKCDKAVSYCGNAVCISIYFFPSVMFPPLIFFPALVLPFPTV